MSHRDNHVGLFVSRRRELVDYAAAIVGNRSQSEDVVQEAFLRLEAGVADRNLEKPFAYIRRVVCNVAIDLIRSASLERRRGGVDVDQESVAEDQPSPEDVVAHRDELRLVMNAIAELPERTRIALEMHRLEGKKLREIADHLGISVALAHALVYEGLEHCQLRLTRRR